MVDIREEVYPILQSIAPTYYEYPPILVECAEKKESVPQEYFPMISYFDSNHEGDNYFDGKATTDDVEITIDCWERADINTGEIKEIHFDVDKALIRNGYRRTMYQHPNEDDTNIEHYAIKYKKFKEETP